MHSVAWPRMFALYCCYVSVRLDAMTRVGELFLSFVPSSDASVTTGGVSFSEKLDFLELEAKELKLISSFCILPFISLLLKTSTYCRAFSGVRQSLSMVLYFDLGLSLVLFIL